MAKKIKKITLAELAALLLSGDKLFNGCSFAGLTTLTDIKLTGGQKNPMINRVTKLNEGQLVLLFTNKTSSAYQNMVRKRLIEDHKNPDDFSLSSNWFQHIPNTSLVAKKSDITCLYLQVLYAERKVSMLEFCEDNGIRVEQTDKDLFNGYIKSYESMHKSKITYLLDGLPIDKNKIEGLPIDTVEGRQGNLREDMKVVTRTFKMESITSLTIGGNMYIVE